MLEFEDTQSLAGGGWPLAVFINGEWSMLERIKYSLSEIPANDQRPTKISSFKLEKQIPSSAKGSA
jgi:hypothetical protein